MKKNPSSKLKNTARALTLSAAVGGGMFGCIPAKTAELELQSLKLQQCSAETRQDINAAIQEIINNLPEINWTEVHKNCSENGKYAREYDCSNKTLETLRSNYMNILAKLLKTQKDNAIYCPYDRSSKKDANAFVIDGDDDSIFLNKPIKENCELQGSLMHEAGHLEEGKEGMEKIDRESHNNGTDYVYMVGMVAERACERTQNSKKLAPIIDDINQFLKERGVEEKK